MRANHCILCLAALIVLAVLPSNKIHAQQAINTGTDFYGIRCQGAVPDDLRKGLEQLYNEDKQRVREYSNGKLPNRDKVYNASYYISQLMASGRILYGDPITEMLENIVDTLLIDYPDLRKEIRIYTVKSSEVNAFATGQGMLFVNLGMVAQVEDEAQLAFVLSHEIVHYLRKHNLETLTRKRNTRDTTGQGLSDFLRYHNRSREMETEADSLGLALFYRNSPYDKRVTEGFFDVLQYGYLPFDEIEFDTNQFSTSNFQLSKGTFLEKVKPISAREDYNDSTSTHPNLLKRRIATTRQMATLHGGDHYVVTTKQQFEQLRTLARMECIRQDLLLAEYASAYYNCYVLLPQLPDNDYLKLARIQALYGVAKFRMYSVSANVTDSRDKEGEVQQAYHFMRRGKPEELAITAIRELWKTHREVPDEKRITDMAGDLIRDLHVKYNHTADYYATSFDTVSDNSAVDTSSSRSSKYNNVKKRRRAQESKSGYRLAFTDIMVQDPDFTAFFNDWIAKPEDNKKPEKTGKSAFLFASGYHVYNGSNSEINISKSVNGEQNLVGDLKDCLEKEGIATTDFSDASMRSHTDADFYNDFLTLNEWTNEYWQNRGKVPMIYTTQPLMDNLMERYNADKLSLGTVINLEHVKNNNDATTILIGLACVVTIPEVIYSIMANHEATMVSNQLVDTRTGQPLSKGSTYCQTRDSRAHVRSHTYAIMENGLNPDKAPGYMDRHLLIVGNAGISFPVINHFFNREKTDNVASRWGGSAEYAITKNGSIALTYDVGKTTFDIKKEPLLDAKISTLGLQYRWYLNDNIAPLGTYFGAGLSMANVNLTPTTVGTSRNYIEPTINRYAIQLECGRNYIYFDRIALNISVRHNLTFANPIEPLDYFDYWSSTSDYRKLATRSFNANLWTYNLISLHISLGVIPF